MCLVDDHERYESLVSQLSRASGLALMMLAAGRPDNPIGWVLVGREVGLLGREIGRAHRARGERTELARSSPSYTANSRRSGFRSTQSNPASVELDRETKAAKRATAPLDPATRDTRQDSGDRSDVEAVRRVIDPTGKTASASMTGESRRASLVTVVPRRTSRRQLSRRRGHGAAAGGG